MELNLGENIKNYRKSAGLTQENLADAMGVSIGAVSKWESGSTAPELTMLAALAEFFETSVDALIGYGAQPCGVGVALERIKDAMTARDWQRGRAEVAKALQKYPNHFETLHQSARFCYLCGLVEGDRAELERSLSLYERAAALLSLNTNAEINEFSLQCEISRVYQSLGRATEAVEILKKYNYSGVNNEQIGSVLIQQKRFDEAAEYFSSSLLDCVVKLFYTATGFVNCYAASGEYAAAAELLEWICPTFAALKGERINYLWVMESLLRTLQACAFLSMRDAAHAEEALGCACELAAAFDRAPNYRIDGMKFYSGKPGFAYDNIGSTAAEGIVALIDSQDAAEREQLRAIYSKLRGQTDE